MTDRDWQDHAIFIMRELERFSTGIEQLNDKIVSLKIDIESLKIKSGLWGAAGAAIPVIGLLLYQLIKT